MSYSFEYIDIILLAMIAGFIFLRLRGILGKRTGFEGKAPSQLKEVLKSVRHDKPKKINEVIVGSARRFISQSPQIQATQISSKKINDPY